MLQGDPQVDISAGDYIMLSISDTGYGINKEVQSRIYSYEDIGGTFKILLPQPSDGAAADPQRSESTEELNRSKGAEIILVVEDEELVASHITRLLNRKGYQVLVAHTPLKALEIFAQHSQIQLVITDVVMPEMNGKDLAFKIHQSKPKMKVLYMSGYPQEIISQKGILDPNISFIAKPFHSNEFCRRVREILDAHA